MDTSIVTPNLTMKDSLNKLFTFIKNSEPYQELYKKTPVVLFLSIGYKNKRATVLSTNKLSFEQAWRSLYKMAENHLNNDTAEIEVFKIDWVDSIEKVSIVDFIKIMTQTKKNYFRKGISFDPEFRQAFLEQEINGNAMIQLDQKTGRGYLADKNIQAYIEQHRPGIKKINYRHVNGITIFTTQGFILENNQCFLLKKGELDNGRRDTILDADELKKMILNGQRYLTKLNLESGKFIYGYFSCFDKEIKFYNMLRHASTLYSMIEAYELFPEEELAQAIQRGLHYLVRFGIAFYEKDNLAFVLDGVKEDEIEIKLGANAAAILAFTKYTEVFQDEKYLPIAQKLARGILYLQRENGSFIHVLQHPSLKIKEEFRIIYYDGEAAFALMRLYRLDKDDTWLHAVEKAFEFFIAKEYWRYHDHWLSYCTNELTQYRPLQKYFQFGLQNVKDRLDFIYQRNTTFPTFLELTLAAYKMVQRIKKTEHVDLLESFDEEKLNRTLHKRAEYQRNGYFAPELAIYYKNPARIMGSFFIRHHSFRTRIDDVEHYLSGYCNYYKLFFQRMSKNDKEIDK